MPSHQPPPPPETKATPSDYVDLQPGWRLRVVFPILRSGGYIAVAKEVPSENGTVKLKTTDDFLGYERSYYSIKPRVESGIRIGWIKTEVWEKGKFHSRPKTRLPLFDAMANDRYIRLVYLIRASAADHNMALVGASDQATLDAITKSVTTAALCESSSGGICTWVPAGVAVTPEEKLTVGGKKVWTLAR